MKKNRFILIIMLIVKSGSLLADFNGDEQDKASQEVREAMKSFKSASTQKKSCVKIHYYSNKTYNSDLDIKAPASLESITVSRNLTIEGDGSVDITSSTVRGHLDARTSLNVKSSTLKSATVLGSVTLDCTSMQGELMVDGPLSITASTIKGTINVAGPVSLSGSTVGNLLKIGGTLSARSSTLEDIVITTNEKIVLDDTTIKGLLTIKAPKGKEIEVIVRGKSKIRTIEFAPDVVGTVIIEDKTASVGSVRNGTIK